ncbi:MAG: GDSL-type esterase/lipase family protein [Verrucomicrobiota bacterium]
MKPRHILTGWLLLAALMLPAMAQNDSAAPRKRRVDASAPTEKVDPTGRFQELHAAFLARTKAGPMGLLFLGDSITAGWSAVPEIWEKYFGRYQPANFGIGGDQTQHVLWRLEHGELENIRPKVVVLMLGTNNTVLNTGEEIAAADEKIVRTLRQKLPETKVLLLAIFPRGPRKQGKTMDDAVNRMRAIREANARLAALDDGRWVRFLDIGPRFLDDEGSIPASTMPDQLHLSPAGYQIWAEAIAPTLAEMMK